MVKFCGENIENGVSKSKKVADVTRGFGKKIVISIVFYQQNDF